MVGDQVLLRVADRAVAMFDAEWDALAAANPKATSFQTAWWYRTWARVVAPSESCTPVVLTAQRGSTRVACAFAICSGETGDVVRPLGWPWSDYHDAVGPGCDEAVSLVAAMLRRLSGELAVELDDVRPDGLLARAASRLGIVAQPSSQTVSIDLRDAPHLRRITGRREHATKRRRLERMGPLRCAHLREPEAVARWLPRFIEMHREQWRGRTDAVAPFDGGVVDEAFREVGDEGARHGGVVLTVLTIADDPIAMYYGFAYRSWYGGYRTTFRRSASRHSPGHLMLHGMIHTLRSLGFKELDLMRGGYAYKMEYASIVSHNLALSMG